MKLSARARYAARIMVILAEHRDAIVNTTGLSEQTGVSVQFIEQIIRPLKQAGLVASTRGVAGGHAIARPPADISLGDIVRAIEGDIDLTQCCNDGSADQCPRNADCPTRPAWRHVSAILERELDAIRLADLVPQRGKPNPFLQAAL